MTAKIVGTTKIWMYAAEGFLQYREKSPMFKPVVSKLYRENSLRVAHVPWQAVTEYMKAMKRGEPGAARLAGLDNASDAPDPAFLTAYIVSLSDKYDRKADPNQHAQRYDWNSDSFDIEHPFKLGGMDKDERKLEQP